MTTQSVLDAAKPGLPHLLYNGLTGPYSSITNPPAGQPPSARPPAISRPTFNQIDDLLDDMGSVWPYNFAASTSSLPDVVAPRMLSEPRPLFVHKTSANSHYSQASEYDPSLSPASEPEPPLSPAPSTSTTTSTASWSSVSTPGPPSDVAQTPTHACQTPMEPPPKLPRDVYVVSDSTGIVISRRSPSRQQGCSTPLKRHSIHTYSHGPVQPTPPDPAVPGRSSFIFDLLEQVPAIVIPNFDPHNNPTDSIKNDEEDDSDSDSDLIPEHPAVRPPRSAPKPSVKSGKLSPSAVGTAPRRSLSLRLRFMVGRRG